jgi:hypothetical protein
MSSQVCAIDAGELHDTAKGAYLGHRQHVLSQDLGHPPQKTINQTTLSSFVFALGSVRKSVHLIQKVSNETNTKEIIRRNFQPIPFRFVGAIDPTVKADPRFSGVRIDHRQEKEEHSEGKQSIRRP